jgi:hypothetical protein
MQIFDTANQNPQIFFGTRARVTHIFGPRRALKTDHPFALAQVGQRTALWQLVASDDWAACSIRVSATQQ